MSFFVHQSTDPHTRSAYRLLIMVCAVFALGALGSGVRASAPTLSSGGAHSPAGIPTNFPTIDFLHRVLENQRPVLRPQDRLAATSDTTARVPSDLSIVQLLRQENLANGKSTRLSGIRPAPRPIGALTRGAPLAPLPQGTLRDPALAPVPSAVPQRRASTPSSGPVPRNVANAATLSNALDMRNVRLLGVAGKGNKRTALVRFPNGGILRLSVGDQFDGGTVVAISTSSVRYVRGNEALVLSMPRLSP